jgi:hypothetical protein
MVLAAALLPGCAKRHDSDSASQGSGSHRYGPPRQFPGPPHQLKRSDLTEAEQKYGIAPVREAHIHIADMPIDFGEAIVYRSSDLPGQVVSGALAGPRASVVPAMFAPEPGWKLYPVQAAPGPVPPVTNQPDVSKLLDKNFKSAPYVTTSAVGMRANVDALLQPDTDFSIPVGGLGPVPIAVTVRQRFKITTALGVRDSPLTASGDYTFNGGLRSIIPTRNGAWPARWASPPYRA